MCAFPDLNKLRQQAGYDVETMQPPPVARPRTTTATQTARHRNVTPQRQPTRSSYWECVNANCSIFFDFLESKIFAPSVVITQIGSGIFILVWFISMFMDIDGGIGVHILGIILLFIMAVLMSIPVTFFVFMAYWATAGCVIIVGFLVCAFVSIFDYLSQ